MRFGGVNRALIAIGICIIWAKIDKYGCKQPSIRIREFVFMVLFGLGFADLFSS
jgi:hypothetical protein